MMNLQTIINNIKLETMKSNHTKGIWYFEKHPKWSEYVGNITVDLGHPNIRTVACILDYAGTDEAVANAEHIVKCVNAHDELVKACHTILSNFKANQNFGTTLNSQEITAGINILENALKQVDAELITV